MGFDLEMPIELELIDNNGVLYKPKQIDGKFRTSSKPYLYDIAEGHIDGHEPFRRHGHNALVSNAWETVYHGSDLYTYLTSAESLHVISSDAQDTAAGTGARTLYISGLDGNYERQTETITLNGDVGYVATSGTYLRLFTAYAKTAGTGGTNAGTISIKNTAETVTLDTIAIGCGMTHTAIFTIPANQKGFVTDLYFSEATNKGVEFGLWLRTYGGAWRMLRNLIMLQTSFQLRLSLPYEFAAKTDLEIRAIGTVIDANVTAGFSGWRENI